MIYDIAYNTISQRAFECLFGPPLSSVAPAVQLSSLSRKSKCNCIIHLSLVPCPSDMLHLISHH